MKDQIKKSQDPENDSMKITVTKNGPYIATGGVPIVVAEICNDNEGYCPDLEDR